MSAWAFVTTIGLGVAGAALVLGCEADAQSGGGGYMGSGGGSSSSGGSGSSSGGGSTQPMLVDVDPNQTMNAAPGEGVGVFIEYKTGGHWHIWWTCDTTKTGQSCGFDNVVSVASGSITNVTGATGQQSSSPTAPMFVSVQATTTTTANIDEMTFDTPFSPGETPIITLDAKLGGVENGQYLFFVQRGQINGGYRGMLTDPLMLEPSTP